jgi:hypothetical protein
MTRKTKRKRKKKIPPSFDFKKSSTHTKIVCVSVHRVALLFGFCFFIILYLIYLKFLKFL